MPLSLPVSPRSVLRGSAVLLIAIFLGLAAYELWAARGDWAKLASLSQRRVAGQQRLARLQADAKAAAIAPSPQLQVTAQPAPRPQGNPGRESILARRAAGQAYAKAFFSKYPQARAMLIEFQTRNMENYYAPFFRAAGMSQAQIDTFIARTAEAHLNSLVLNPGGDWSNGQPNLSADEIRSLVGDSGYQQWQDAARAIPAENWVGGLAAAVKNGATPLSADQALELTQIVATSSPDYTAGKRVNVQAVDLNNVLEQAKPLLTEAQWQQAQTYLTMQSANQQLEALIKGGQ